MESATSGSQLVREVQRAWDDALQTPLIPDDIQLISLRVQSSLLEAVVTDASGVRFGYSVVTPISDSRPPAYVLGEDFATPDVQRWALWEVIVPLVEEIETDAMHRYPADAIGIRWVSQTRPRE